MSSVSPYFALSSQGGGSTPNLQTKSVTISSFGTTVITADEGYDGLQQVNLTVQAKIKPVGGRIFYIDSGSTKTYKFYDSNFEEISSVAVGDTPMFYEELSEGNGNDKYYVYHDALYTSKCWTYSDSNDEGVYEELGTDTSQSFGTGKSNTAIIMSYNNGIYATSQFYYNGIYYDTVWKLLKNMRDSAIGGCNDWYVGSPEEYNTLRTYMNDNPSVVENLFGSDHWTSTESDSDAINKARKRKSSAWFSQGKGDLGKVIAIRSF